MESEFFSGRIPILINEEFEKKITELLKVDEYTGPSLNNTVKWFYTTYIVPNMFALIILLFAIFYLYLKWILANDKKKKRKSLNKKKSKFNSYKKKRNIINSDYLMKPEKIYNQDQDQDQDKNQNKDKDQNQDQEQYKDLDFDLDNQDLDNKEQNTDKLGMDRIAQRTFAGVYVDRGNMDGNLDDRNFGLS